MASDEARVRVARTSLTRSALPLLTFRPVTAVLSAAAIGFVVGLWTIRARFGLHQPSLVDDWYSIDYSPRAFHELIHLHYGHPPVDSPQRYRPTYVAVWNYLQWHTFGGSIVAANAWNLIRLALFALSLAGASVAVNWRVLRGAWLVAVGLLPAVLVLTTPGTAVDFARFGPGDPQLIAALIGGGLLLILALRRVLNPRITRRGRDHAGTVAMTVIGSMLFLFGAYMKEASVFIIVLTPFLYIWLDRSWKEDGIINRSLWRHRSAQGLALLIAAPLAHVAYHSVTIAERGRTVYTSSPTGVTGWATSFLTSFKLQLLGDPSRLQTYLWLVLSPLLPILIILFGWSRRRIPWLCAGLVLTAWAFGTFQIMGGAEPSRYFISGLALEGLAISILVARTRPPTRGIVIFFTVILVSLSGARHAVAAWTRLELDGAAVVNQASQLHPSTCRVFLANFDPERQTALGRLIRNDSSDSQPGGCEEGFDAVLLDWQARSLLHQPIAMACVKPGWILLHSSRAADLYGCSRTDETKTAVLRSNRLLPATNLGEPRLFH